MSKIQRYEIIVDEVNFDAIKPVLQEGLKNFNFSFFGCYELQRVAFYTKNAMSEVIGGVCGFIIQEYKTLRLEFVWVKEENRYYGIGTCLFKRLEEYALSKNCNIIQVSTMEFQGTVFYQKMGYELIATIPKWFCDRDELFIIKKLDRKGV